MNCIISRRMPGIFKQRLEVVVVVVDGDFRKETTVFPLCHVANQAEATGVHAIMFGRSYGADTDLLKQ